MQDFSELERLMDNVNKTPISEFDKKLSKNLVQKLKKIVLIYKPIKI